jgi:NAD-dependent deacetylase
MKAAEILLEDPPFTVITGAGISVESGLPPFRGPGGIWERYDPEVYGHIDTFKKDPEKAWVLFREMYISSIDARPNGAHEALGRLQKNGIAGPIITQNVDRLHELGGAKDVIDVHGNITRIHCVECGKKIGKVSHPIEIEMFRCDCGSFMRPDIVLYGEQLPTKKIDRAWKECSNGKPILIIGTSGVVLPVAYLPIQARGNGSRLVLLDPYPDIGYRDIVDITIREKAVYAMEELEKALLKLYEH